MISSLLLSFPGGSEPIIIVVALIILLGIIAVVKSGKDEPATQTQNNRVITVNLIGGIIGFLASSPNKRLNERIQLENNQGWRVVQIIPAASGNLFLIIFRMILLVITLFLFTFETGYYIVLERK